jgi:hypothetical protein
VFKFYPVLTPLFPWRLHGGSGTALPLLHSISYWKLYYCFHKEFILSHLNPVDSLTLCFLVIDIYIAISITKSAKYLHLYLQVFRPRSLHFSFSMSYSSHCPRFSDISNIDEGNELRRTYSLCSFFHIVISSGSDVLSALFITPSADYTTHIRKCGRMCSLQEKMTPFI